MSKASAEQFSLAGDQFLGKSYKVMDCQAFVENCMKAVGIKKDLAGSNAWYRAMTWVGTPEECKKKFGGIPKGALLYILKFDGGEKERGYKDGIGNAQHIGIKTGRGKGAIHSSSSKGCVCESAFADKSINGGWNRIGLSDLFDYGEKINTILTGAQGGGEGSEKKMDKYYAIVDSADDNPVKLRKTASTGAKVLAKVPDGDTVCVLEETSDKWAQVEYNGQTGYMMRVFLQPTISPGDVSPESLARALQLLNEAKEHTAKADQCVEAAILLLSAAG